VATGIERALRVVKMIVRSVAGSRADTIGTRSWHEPLIATYLDSPPSVAGRQETLGGHGPRSSGTCWWVRWPDTHSWRSP